MRSRQLTNQELFLLQYHVYLLENFVTLLIQKLQVIRFNGTRIQWEVC